MSHNPPKIDERTYDKLIADLETLAEAYSGWRPGANGDIDAGGALIRIFSMMSETAIDRLNKVPEKNFLAFLDLIGTHVLPPRPARVPLTFLLAEGAATDALVPARTQVGATLLEGEEEEVNFETEDDLVATPAQIKAVFVRQPKNDKYEDNTAKATAPIDVAFSAFEANQPTEHSLFIANDKLLTLPGIKGIKITILTLAGDAKRLEMLGLNWFFWDGTGWQPLAVTPDPAANNNWNIQFQSPPLFRETEAGEVNARWLRASMDRALPPVQVAQQNLPVVDIFAGTTALDSELPFHPFSKAGEVFDLYLEPVLTDVPDDLIAAGKMMFSLDLALPDNTAPAGVVLKWQFLQERTGWKNIGESRPADPSSGEQSYQFVDGTQAFTKSGRVTFELPEDKPVRSLNNLAGRWLRVTLESGTFQPQINSVEAGYAWQLPEIQKIEIEVDAEITAVAPVKGFYNNQELDLTKDFFPFGERPRFNDTFYLRSDETFATAGAEVSVDIALSDYFSDTGTSVYNGNIEIAWETYNGAGWVPFHKLAVTAPSATAPSSIPVSTSTKAFTTNGKETFTIPDDITQAVVRGESGYWIRARIVKGDFGKESSYEYTTDPDTGGTTAEVVPPTLSPPSFKSLTLGYKYKKTDSPGNCLRYHDFSYEDVTGSTLANTPAFRPFTPTKDTQPSLYVGFDRAFSNRPMTLYAGVEPPLPGEIAAAIGSILKSKAKVVWEYYSQEGWTNLGASDFTDAFSERGLVKFIGPVDFTSHQQFGRNLYWLRTRWYEGDFRVMPRLCMLLTNTMWASHSATIRNEQLGSGNGSPAQTFTALRSPVMPGVQLEVMEPELPSENDLERIRQHEGEDAVTLVLDSAGRPEEIWVRWHEVSDFYGSGPQDRHFAMNHQTGEIRFGDGQNGMIPPLARNNVRIALYRAGGGEVGNRMIGTVNVLKTSIPYVDSVINHEPASGGAEEEALERVQERGPKTLRHRDRAITAADMEDLAYEASADVARALAITPHFDPNDMQWLPVFSISLNRAGEIEAEIKRSDSGDEELHLALYGPGQGLPYREAEGSDSSLIVTYDVTQEQFEAGGLWRVEVRNLSETRLSSGELKITYPDGASGTSTLDVPTAAEIEIVDSGKIELIIVPDSSAELPTPTLNLINMVEDFILERCTPTMQLWVTEPDWVKVTVEAEIIPASLKVADALNVMVNAEIRRFLHPLTGGLNGQGWSFGRRPHESDLIALIESMPGVDYVRSFSVESNPSLAEEGEEIDPSIKRLPDERRDRYLIYSGTHKISVVAT